MSNTIIKKIYFCEKKYIDMAPNKRNMVLRGDVWLETRVI